MNATRTLLSALVLFAAAVSTATAQFSFDPNIGTPLGLNDDAIAFGNPLGFDFTFPDGTVVDHIDIDSNGRILPPGGAGFSDSSEHVWEMIERSTSICLFWDDLDPGDGLSDGVYFNTYSDAGTNAAVITWYRIVEKGQTTVFTVQLTIREDDSFSMYWGPNTPATDGIVGACEGNGTPDPGNSNFNCGPVLVTNGRATVYEHFPNGTFDLQGFGVWFLREVGGGYTVVTSATGGTCTRPIPPTQAYKSGVGCGGFTPPATVVEYQPDGSGGYFVNHSSASFDSNLGDSLGITGNNETAAAPLGFTFMMPSGVIVDTLVVDSNGRLMTNGTSDNTPNLTDFFNQPDGMIAPMWGNFDVSSDDSTGTIMFESNQTDYATITWDGVVQHNGYLPLTMQVQIFGSAHPTRPDTFIFVYEDMGGLDTRGITATNFFVGCCNGIAITDLGETDLSALPIAPSGNPNIYEEFNWFAFDTFDIVPPSRPHLDLIFGDSLPVIGGDFDLTLRHINPGASAAWMLIGFQDVGLDLTPIGAPCTLYSSINIPAQPMAWSLGSTTATYSLPISGAPGIPLVLQAAVVNMGANPLNVEFSNAVRAYTGP